LREADYFVRVVTTTTGRGEEEGTVRATKPQIASLAARRIAIAVLALVALAVPAAAIAAAEQIRITLVDEPAGWDLDDPCTGQALHGLGAESGTVHIVELGDQGFHVRVKVEGSVDLFDDEETFVGTFTYRVNFGDQFPPDGQGGVRFWARGPLDYADGTSAMISVFEHEVFAKGDILKREFVKANCH